MINLSNIKVVLTFDNTKIIADETNELTLPHGRDVKQEVEKRQKQNGCQKFGTSRALQEEGHEDVH